MLGYLRGSESVTNVIHLPGSAQKPPGDLILCDVAREDCSVITAGLTKFGLKDVGAVAVESIEAMLSDAAEDAEDHAAGAASDAVVWEQVSAQTSESAELSASFLAFMHHSRGRQHRRRTAYGDMTEVGGSTQQLAINLGMLLLSGVCTLMVQRFAFVRRLRAARSGRNRPRG